MKIYHGSLEVVERPRILPSNRLLDYGIGFYTTTSEQQSREWVARRMSEHEVQVGYVNIYEFDDRQLRELKCLLFSDGVETLIRELKTYRLVDQYLFHTERGLSALRFTEAIKIEK